MTSGGGGKGKAGVEEGAKKKQKKAEKGQLVLRRPRPVSPNFLRLAALHGVAMSALAMDVSLSATSARISAIWPYISFTDALRLRNFVLANPAILHLADRQYGAVHGRSDTSNIGAPSGILFRAPPDDPLDFHCASGVSDHRPTSAENNLVWEASRALGVVRRGRHGAFPDLAPPQPAIQIVFTRWTT